MWIYLIWMCVLVIVDQALKFWIVTNIPLGSSEIIIPHVLAFTNIRNTGAAWSILSGQQWFFTIITLIALSVMTYFFWKLRDNRYYLVALTILIAGTLGNFIDRIRLGYVVDMFETLFIDFPIFNIADSCLTIGVILMIIALIKDEKNE